MASQPPPPPPRFWDVAPRPSLTSYFIGAVLGPSQDILANPPTRLAAAVTTMPPPPPRGLRPYELLPPARITEFCQFLRENFVTGRTGGPTYILDPLKVAHDILHRSLRPLIVCNAKGQIVGCISSIHIGRLCRNGSQQPTPFVTRLIRDFCVHPKYRGNGLGSYLLFSVWNDTRQIGEDAVLFLKEGAPIGRAGPSIMSSTWIYRRMKEVEDVSRVQRVPWSVLPGELVRFTEGRTDVLFNIPGAKQGTPDSVPLLYKTFRGSVLASFTRTHQQHPEDGEMICYETGWIERGELLDAEREDALMQLSAAAAAILGCYWVWCSSRAGASTSVWKQDGQFHWYAFHWTPGFYRNLNLWLSL